MILGLFDALVKLNEIYHSEFSSLMNTYLVHSKWFYGSVSANYNQLHCILRPKVTIGRFIGILFPKIPSR